MKQKIFEKLEKEELERNQKREELLNLQEELLNERLKEQQRL